MAVRLNLGTPKEGEDTEKNVLSEGEKLNQNNKKSMDEMMKYLKGFQNEKDPSNIKGREFDDGNTNNGINYGGVVSTSPDDNSITIMKPLGRKPNGEVDFTTLSLTLTKEGNFILKNSVGGDPITLKPEEAKEWLGKFESRVQQAKDKFEEKRKEELKKMVDLAKNEDQSGAQNLLNDTSKVWV